MVIRTVIIVISNKIVIKYFYIYIYIFSPNLYNKHALKKLFEIRSPTSSLSIFCF